MKKLFFACAIAISALAIATAGNSTENSTAMNSNPVQDTIPKKDTTQKPIPDSINIYAVNTPR